jgi:tRNA uridine 5-carbamoylmethylation protein Kti12
MKVYILRGLPGSGKSTFSKNLAREKGENNISICSADDYFIGSDGVYRFSPQKLKDAHLSCKEKFVDSLNNEVPFVVVDNTNTQKWEFENYMLIAKEYGYSVEIVNFFDGGLTDKELAKRNTHGVPEEKIKQMRERFQPDP